MNIGLYAILFQHYIRDCGKCMCPRIENNSMFTRAHFFCNCTYGKGALVMKHIHSIKCLFSPTFLKSDPTARPSELTLKYIYIDGLTDSLSLWNQRARLLS